MLKKNLLWMVLNLISGLLFAQKNNNLTIEKIMADPKISVGTSPSYIWWSADSKIIYFDWNPDKNTGDSLYSYNIFNKTMGKVTLNETEKLIPESGEYNDDYTQKVFERNGDIYLSNLKDFSTKKITFTIESESNPKFINQCNEIVFIKDKNLFAFEINSGVTRQLTNIKSGKKKEEKKQNDQQKWLENDQLLLFQVLKERKDKAELYKKRMDANKPAYPKVIYTGNKEATNLLASPTSNYITYNLIDKNKSVITTEVPNYVTNSGFTEDIQARSKVGAVQDQSEFWIFDAKKNTARKLNLKGLIGIHDKPDYLKDYPKQDTAWKNKERETIVHGPYWSKSEKNAIIVIRSTDNKDRWIASLDPDSLNITVLDRQ